MSDRGRGHVSVVGAGPGDPGLITVAGLDRLRQADVVVYDRLAAPRLLQAAPDTAERIYVGKAAGAHAVPQHEINQLLVERAQAGCAVVRLKGGDPFVFGRGGEEAEALVAAGVPFDIVPGVSAAIAAPAYAGIPITHRAAASSFTVVTGHEDESKDESTVDWSSVARSADTIVVLMGLRALPQIMERLIAAGRDPGTPAAAIQSGTTPQQRVVSSTLGALAAATAEAGLKSPVLIVVGEVARLRDRLRWFERRPLFGRSVLVTRTRRQASTLVGALAAEGADPIEFPAIELTPADPAPVRAAISTLASGGFDWLILTSANGVQEFFCQLDAAGLDARALAGVRLAVIGTETARALQQRGLRADVVPERFVAEALVDALAAEPMQNTRVLLARAAQSRDLLPEALRARGAQVDDLPLYVSNRPATPDPDIVRRLEAGEIDIATFTASSTVTGCLDLLDGRTELLRDAFVACIGPVTARTAREAGLHVDLVSEPHTIPGLVGALCHHFSGSAEGMLAHA